MRGFLGALCAIGFGAIVGALVALSIDPSATGWWILGALAGGMTAYGTYDYRATWWAVKKVFIVPAKVVAEFARMFFTRQFYMLWGAWMAIFGGMVSIAIPIVVGIDLLDRNMAGSSFVMQHLAIGVIALSAFGGFIALLLYGSVAERYSNHQKQREELRELATESLGVSKYLNLVTLVRYAPIGIWMFVQACAKVVVLIHNDTRALCFLYGSFGAAAGFLLGHFSTGILHIAAPLFGAAAGIGLATTMHKLFPQRPVTVVQ
jgi:hypothetical protein